MALNSSESMHWKEQTLGEVLERQARERGKADALVTPKKRFTYEALYLRARSAAGTMHTLGIRRGDHVGIVMGNDEKWLALFYGAALIGAVTVPVNTRFKRGEIEFCLRQADVKALFYVKRFLKIDFEEMLAGIKPGICIDASGGIPAGQFKDVEAKPDDPLLIQFTSGTTAYPKGAMLTHDNMLRDAWAAGARI